MRIVVCRQLGGIGDVLAMSCVYRGLKETYPNSTVSLVCGLVYLAGALVDIAEHNPFIDNIYTIEPYDAVPAQTRLVWGKYFGNSPSLEDEIIWKQADLTFDLNIPCVQYEWGAMLNGGIKKPRYQIWCEAANVQPSTYFPVYCITPTEFATADAFLASSGWTGKRLVGIGVSSCDNKRAIANGKIHDVCEGLREAGLFPVTIDPTFKFPDVPGIIGKRVSELMPIISRMEAMVTVDSGLLHMAGAVGTPTIGIFGPTDYRMRTALYKGSSIDSRNLMPCAPCWYAYPCRNNPNPALHFQCLNKIRPEVIIEETLRWCGNP